MHDQSIFQISWHTERLTIISTDPVIGAWNVGNNPSWDLTK